MSIPKNDPITLELPAFLVDVLAEWARADAQYMRTDVSHVTFQDALYQRDIKADSLVRSLIYSLPAFSAEGDLADAINERAKAHAEFRDAKLSKMEPM